MDAGLVTEAQLRVALSEQRKWGGRLGHTLVQLGYVEEQAMVTSLSRQLNLAVVDLDAMELSPQLAQHLRFEVAERYGVVPLSADTKKRHIQVATSDPTHQDVMQALTFQTGMKVELVVSGSGAIDRALRRVYGKDRRQAAGAQNPVQEMAEKVESLAARVADLEAKLELQQKVLHRLLEQESAHGEPLSEAAKAQPAPAPPA